MTPTYLLTEISLSISFGVRQGLSISSWKRSPQESWQHNTLFFLDTAHLPKEEERVFE